MSDDIEELQFELEARVLNLGLGELHELAEKLDVQLTGTKRSTLARGLIAELAKRIDESTKKEDVIKEVNEAIDGEIPPLEDPKVDKATPPAIEIKDNSTGKDTTGSKVSLDVSKVIKKDLKIHGVIGADGVKDNLTFISIERQINTAIASSYTENEIIESVIRAVSPNSKLRFYLEMQSNLSLGRLKQILRAHFKQKSGTELYQELSNLCQNVNESAQDFLMRAMNVRQQVILSAERPDESIKYDPKLVQALFVHVVETGFRDESIRAKLRPLLERADVQDEELMERLNVAVSAEAERLNKISDGAKKTRVNEIAQVVNKQKHANNAQDGQTKEAKTNKLMAALEAVQSDLSYLKGVVNKTSSPSALSSNINTHSHSPTANSNHNIPKATNQRQRRRCDACNECNNNDCDHCFICGSSEHFARGCKLNRNQGNGKRLLSRDRQ